MSSYSPDSEDRFVVGLPTSDKASGRHERRDPHVQQELSEAGFRARCPIPDPAVSISPQVARKRPASAHSAPGNTALPSGITDAWPRASRSINADGPEQIRPLTGAPNGRT